MNHKPYGLEILLDLKGCDLSDLSRERLTDYFVRLCELIQMTRHGEPVFWEDHSGQPHLQGISALQFIETSNVVCHALPGVRYRGRQTVQCRILGSRIGRLYGGDPDLTGTRV
jgi:hypothetical protein